MTNIRIVWACLWTLNQMRLNKHVPFAYMRIMVMTIEECSSDVHWIFDQSFVARIFDSKRKRNMLAWGSK